MKYPAARNTMLRLAGTFEKLAERLEDGTTTVKAGDDRPRDSSRISEVPGK
jgi:hypothetical protein